MLIEYISKCIHLLSMAGILGGTFFALLVLSPAMKKDPDNVSLKLMWKRFGITVAVLWLCIIVTGVYNLKVVTPTVNAGYQELIGMKMMLAVIMFLVTMFVAHPMGKMGVLVRNKSNWLAGILVLGIVIVGMSAWLNISRVDGTGLKRTVSAAPVTTPMHTSNQVP